MTNLAGNDTGETAAFIRELVESGLAKYPRLCLQLQREARDIPLGYPTALSAANATPKSERVYDRADWKRGMTGFSYDPNIPGTAGHTFFVAGRDTRGRIITGTNDAFELGVVDYVPVEFYEQEWNQHIQFAATWLNGYDYADFNEKPKPVYPGSLGDQYRSLLVELIKIKNQKLSKHGPNSPLVKALEKDIERMRRRIAKWSD